MEAVYTDKTSPNIHLKNLFFIVRRRTLLIIAISLISLGVTTFMMVRATPYYRAISTIKIEPEMPLGGAMDTTSMMWFYNRGMIWEYYYDTQRQIIMSRQLAANVIAERLLQPTIPDYIKNDFTGPDAIDRLIGGIEVTGSKTSYMATVSYVGTDPEKIAIILNNLIDIYVDQATKEYQRLKGMLVEIIQKETLPVIAKEIEELEKQLAVVEEKSDFLDVEELYRLAKSKNELLTKTLTEVSLKQVKLESELDAFKSFSVDDINVIVRISTLNTEHTIQRLWDEKINFERELQVKSRLIGTGHPHYQELQAEIEAIDTRLRYEAEAIIQGHIINTELSINSTKYEMEKLQGQIEYQVKEMSRFNSKLEERKRLLRKMEQMIEFQNIYLRKQSEATVTKAEPLLSTKVIDHALPPSTPFKPKKTFNIIMAFFLGLAAGIALAFFLDYIDNSIKSSEEVEEIIGINTIGKVPIVRNEKMEITRGPVLFDPVYEVSAFEAFRRIRVEFISECQKTGGSKIVSITSPSASDGKSTISLNLAHSLARDGKKVLLIDSDLRNPALHSNFGKEEGYNLAHYLRNEDVKLTDIITQINGFSLIGCSAPVGNSTEIISSQRYSELLNWARKNYEYVIVDTPPLLIVADSMIIVRKVDSIILIARQYQTRRNDMRQAVKQLRNAGTNIMGAIINCADKSRGEGYYYYDKYYIYSTEKDKPKT